MKTNTMVTLKRFDSDKFKSNFMDCENIVFDKNIWLSLINALRTRFVPKDKPLVKYWRQQCELTALIWSKGSEEVVRELYQELGINVSPALDLLLRRQENKKRME